MKRPAFSKYGLKQVGKLSSTLARARFLNIYSVVVVMLLLAHVIPTSSEVLAQTVYTFSAIADARVLASNPDTNYGTISRLDVDRPGQESYIRFTVSGITDVVQSATLRLFVTNGSVKAPLVSGSTRGKIHPNPNSY